MDRERSDFRERNGRLSSLSDLVVLEARVPEDVHAFALADIPRKVILDGTVKQAIWDGGVRGLALVGCGVTGARPGESVPGYLEQYRSPRPSTRRGAKAYRYVLEMQWPYRERTDLDHLIAFWTMLKERFPRRFGRVDRDTFRVDERRGRMRVFVFTDAPERALAESRALVRSSRIAERMSAAYREVEGDAWTRLLPAGSTEPFEE